jgi:uncharacterized protein YuzE
MAEMKIFHDTVGRSLVVWFGNPNDEVIAENVGDDLIVMKDDHGCVIGFEKLNFVSDVVNSFPLQVTTAALSSSFMNCL